MSHQRHWEKLHNPEFYWDKICRQTVTMYVDHSCRQAASFILKCSWFISTVNGICHSANIEHGARWIERRHQELFHNCLASTLTWQWQIPTSFNGGNHFKWCWYSCWIWTRFWFGSIFCLCKMCCNCLETLMCSSFFGPALPLTLKQHFTMILPTTRTTLLHCYTKVIVSLPPDSFAENALCTNRSISSLVHSDFFFSMEEALPMKSLH